MQSTMSEQLTRGGCRRAAYSFNGPGVGEKGVKVVMDWRMHTKPIIDRCHPRCRRPIRATPRAAILIH